MPKLRPSHDDKRSRKTHTHDSSPPVRLSRPACKHSMWIEEWTLSYIGYGIYVGNMRAACAEILRDNGITHVLSFLKPNEEPEENLDGFVHKKLDIKDEEGSMKKQFTGIINHAIRFIDEGTSGEDKKILVHCKQGRSHSVMIGIAYLKYRKHFGRFQAFCHVAEKRPCLGLHEEFSKLLMEKREEDKENDGPGNFDFTLDGFPWDVMDTAARKNTQDLKKMLKGMSFDEYKHVRDTRRDECVKLAVQFSKRGKSSLSLSNVDLMK